MNLLENADIGSAPCSICSVTGLPILRRPEWTDIDPAKGCSGTRRFIGDRILLAIPRGKSGEHGMENLIREWARVLEAMPGGGLMP